MCVVLKELYVTVATGGPACQTFAQCAPSYCVCVGHEFPDFGSQVCQLSLSSDGGGIFVKRSVAKPTTKWSQSTSTAVCFTELLLARPAGRTLWFPRQGEAQALQCSNGSDKGPPEQLTEASALKQPETIRTRGFSQGSGPWILVRTGGFPADPAKSRGCAG